MKEKGTKDRITLKEYKRLRAAEDLLMEIRIVTVLTTTGYIGKTLPEKMRDDVGAYSVIKKLIDVHWDEIEEVSLPRYKAMKKKLYEDLEEGDEE